MSGGISGFSGGNTPIDKSEFKKLETKITNNGILSPSEKKEVFEVGLNIKDKTKLQELKQGVSPEYPEIHLNIVDLGLIYGIEILEEKNVKADCLQYCLLYTSPSPRD